MKAVELDDKQKALLESAGQVFMRFGLKSVTMDDMARHLRVSKKTLYQFVKDKSDLIQKILERDCCLTENSIMGIVHKNLNAIDELMEISKFVVNELKEIHPSIFYDLEKYYPEAMVTMNELRHEFVSEVMASNLRRGMKEGLYRADLDVDIMTALWVTRLNILFEPNTFPVQQYRPLEVHEQMVLHHIYGIVSDKGRQYFENQHKQSK